MSSGNVFCVSAQQIGKPLIPFQPSGLLSPWAGYESNSGCPSESSCLQREQTVEGNDSVSAKPIQYIISVFTLFVTF